MPFAGSRPAVRRDRGYTLIELMVVVVIIGLASALALPMYADAIVKSKKAALVSEGRKIYGAMMAYYTDYSMFPADSSFDKATMDPLASQGYMSSAARIKIRISFASSRASLLSTGFDVSAFSR